MQLGNPESTHATTSDSGTCVDTGDNPGTFNGNGTNTGSQRDQDEALASALAKLTPAQRNALLARSRENDVNPQAKLTRRQVAEIKALLPTHNNCELGRRYGVSNVAISKIRLGRAWRDVEPADSDSIKSQV